MAIYVNNNKQIENICVSVNGKKKSIISAYINTDNGVKKIFGTSLIPENDPYETAPADAYINWNYTLDDINNIISLNYYTGSETDVIVYASYVIDGNIYKTQIKSNDARKSSYPYKIPYMFNGYAYIECKKIETITFSKNIDTKNITNMYGMFMSCLKLNKLNLNGFDTSNVTDMENMFSQCETLTCLDISHFDTKNVTNMNSLFNYCKKITSLNLSNFDTSNVISMVSMFNSCYELEMIYVTEGKWLTAQADIRNMFYFCNISEVTYI